MHRLFGDSALVSESGKSFLECFSAGESCWLALGFGQLFSNFLSAGGRTSVSERKCIRRRDVRLRKISHSVKVLQFLSVVNFGISIKYAAT